MTRINPEVTRLVSSLQCLGDTGLSIKRQKELYSDKTELLHRRIEKVKTTYANLQPDRPPIELPKKLRFYCKHQMNGLCEHRKDCEFAHTVALWFFANDRHFNGRFKTEPCPNQDQCKFNETNTCNRIHKEDLQYRPIKEFTISDSPPNSPRLAQKSPVKEIPMSGFAVLAELDDADEFHKKVELDLTPPDSPRSSPQISKGSTPMTVPSLAESGRGRSDSFLSEDGVASTPRRSPKYFPDPVFIGMPPLKLIDSPDFTPQNAALSSLLSPPLSPSFRLSGVSPEELLQQTFGDSISLPSTPGSVQSQETTKSMPPLRIESPPLEERIWLVRERSLLPSQEPKSPKSALNEIVKLDSDYKPIEEQVKLANQDLPAFFKKVDTIKKLFSRCMDHLPKEGYKGKMCRDSAKDCFHEDRCHFAHSLATFYARGERYVEEHGMGPFIPYQLIGMGFNEYPARRAVE